MDGRSLSLTRALSLSLSFVVAATANVDDDVLFITHTPFLPITLWPNARWSCVPSSAACPHIHESHMSMIHVPISHTLQNKYRCNLFPTDTRKPVSILMFSNRILAKLYIFSIDVCESIRIYDGKSSNERDKQQSTLVYMVQSRSEPCRAFTLIQHFYIENWMLSCVCVCGCGRRTNRISK